MSGTPGRDILMAVLVGAHGLKGEVRAKIFARTPARLASLGPLHDAAARPFTVTAIRPAPRDEWVVAFAEVRDRTAAEAVRGTKLFVERAQLPDAGADEYYHADLVGLTAVDADGAGIGTVTAVHNFGAGDILEIAGTDGREIMLSFTKANVPVIDIALGRMTVIEPEAVDAGSRTDEG